VFVLLKWLKSEFVIPYGERHKKRVARSSVDMDGRCPARSVSDMCVNSVRIVLSALTQKKSGFGGLGVACWPFVPKFAGSNPAEAVGFLRAKKSSACLPSEGK
jgi:hypothetical protein